MQYGYVAETSHGDVVFHAPMHHEQHRGGLQGWWNDHGHHAYTAIRQALGITQQVLDASVKIISIHEYVQGRRGKKVGNVN